MSFSSKTKNELSRKDIENTCCRVAELSALIRMNGSIHLTGFSNVSVKFSTENAAIARRIFTLLKLLYKINTEVMVRKNRHLKKNNSYIIVVDNSDEAKKILNDTEILTIKDDGLYKMDYTISNNILKNRCCKRSYIRGSFLGGGSINDPEKNYHMEFVSHNIDHGENLSKIINSFGLNSKIIKRKENYVVYLKEGEQIVDLLNIIGAHSSLLALENIRILKEVRNNVNRLVNCETANLSKTIDAAIRQVNNIEYIDKILGINNLPENLVSIAKLRLEFKEISLKELGRKLFPPVGKSGVNYRLKKIDEIADALKMERGE